MILVLVLIENYDTNCGIIWGLIAYWYCRSFIDTSAVMSTSVLVSKVLVNLTQSTLFLMSASFKFSGCLPALYWISLPKIMFSKSQDVTSPSDVRDRSDRKGVKDFKVVKVVKGVKWFKVERLIELNGLRCWQVKDQLKISLKS